MSNEQSKEGLGQKKGKLSRKALLLSFLALLPSVIAKEAKSASVIPYNKSVIPSSDSGPVVPVCIYCTSSCDFHS